jgi:hypothetical protein
MKTFINGIDSTKKKHFLFIVVMVILSFAYGLLYALTASWFIFLPFFLVLPVIFKNYLDFAQEQDEAIGYTEKIVIAIMWKYVYGFIIYSILVDGCHFIYGLLYDLVIDGGVDYFFLKTLSLFIKPIILVIAYLGRSYVDEIVRFSPPKRKETALVYTPYEEVKDVKTKSSDFGSYNAINPEVTGSFAGRNQREWEARNDFVKNGFKQNDFRNDRRIINPQLEFHHPKPIKTRYDQPGPDGWPGQNDVYVALDNKYNVPDFCLHIGGEYIWNGAGHMISFGITQGGKGSKLILPALLHEDNRRYGHSPSFIVVDPQGENAAIAAPYLRSIGYDVHVMNPFQITEILNLGNSRYNLFELFSADDPDLIDMVKMFSYSLIPEAEGKEKHWDDSARLYVSVFLRHLLTQNREPKNIHTLYNWLRISSSADLTKMFHEMMNNKAFDGNIAIDASRIWEEMKSPNGLNHVSNIFSTIAPFLQMFDDKRLIESMSVSDFDLRTVSKKKTAVFVCAERVKIQDNKIWFRTLINAMMRTFSRHYNPERRIVMIMDEFASLGPLKEFEMMMSDTAKYNITLWPIMQGISQLKALYPNSWESYMELTFIRHFMRCTGTTADYLLDLMPEVNVSQKNEMPRYAKIVTKAQIEKECYMTVSGLFSPAPLVDTSYYRWDQTKHNATPSPFRKKPIDEIIDGI